MHPIFVGGGGGQEGLLSVRYDDGVGTKGYSLQRKYKKREEGRSHSVKENPPKTRG